MFVVTVIIKRTTHFVISGVARLFLASVSSCEILVCVVTAEKKTTHFVTGTVERLFHHSFAPIQDDNALPVLASVSIL